MSQDAFDAELKSLFAAEEPADHGGAFRRSVEARLKRRFALRISVLGAAGAFGAGLAASQLGGLFKLLSSAVDVTEAGRGPIDRLSTAVAGSRALENVSARIEATSLDPQMLMLGFMAAGLCACAFLARRVFEG